MGEPTDALGEGAPAPLEVAREERAPRPGGDELEPALHRGGAVHEPPARRARRGWGDGPADVSQGQVERAEDAPELPEQRGGVGVDLGQRPAGQMAVERRVVAAPLEVHGLDGVGGALLAEHDREEVRDGGRALGERLEEGALLVQRGSPGARGEDLQDRDGVPVAPWLEEEVAVQVAREGGGAAGVEPERPAGERQGKLSATGGVLRRPFLAPFHRGRVPGGTPRRGCGCPGGRGIGPLGRKREDVASRAGAPCGARGPR